MNKSPLRQAIESRLVEFINPPKNQISKPHNRLWIAVLGFNMIFFFVDLINGITVGILAFWLYGVLVFFAGILPMLAHEALFANPYASQSQRWISGAGFAFSIFAAVTVGILVVVINVLFDSTPTAKILEAVAMGLLLLIAVFHGGLLALYFFIDSGIRAVQNARAAFARNDRKLQDLAMADEVVSRSKQVLGRLEESVNSGDGMLMGAALESITGENPLSEINKNPTPGRESH